jgi:CRP-like cAMP-binding protein
MPDSPAPDTPVQNRLLRALPRAVFERLAGRLRLVAMARGTQIDRPDGPIQHLYFVNRGFVSMVKTMHDGRSVEVGGIGIEGVTDPHCLFGIDTAILDTVVQIPGEAFRIRRDILKEEVERDAEVRDLFADYARFLLAQIAQTAACNRLHSVEERACRWLLVAHDNALAERIALTHEFLAMMLGVQRAGVSVALRGLKHAGIVDYRRGILRILDRDALEDLACECYQTSRHDLDDLFGAHGRGARANGPLRDADGRDTSDG